MRRKTIRSFAAILLLILLFCESASALEYHDSVYDVTITLPDGWNSRDFEGSMFFYFGEEDSDNFDIIYTTKDVWPDISEEIKAEYTRQDIGNNIYTLDSLKAELKVDNVRMAVYNGYEYFVYDYTYGEQNAKVVEVLHIKNAIAYYFAYIYGNEQINFSVFADMLNSVKYSDPPEAQEFSPNKAPGYNETFTIPSFGAYLLQIFFTVMLVTVITYTVRFGIRKKRLERRGAALILVFCACVVIALYFESFWIPFEIFDPGVGLIIALFVGYKLLRFKDGQAAESSEPTQE